MPAFDDGSFDLVTLWDCIEHLPDPRTVVSLMHRWLRPGGVLAINTVNSSSLGARLAGRNWRHIAPPLHIHMFSKQSLRALVRDVGFSVIDENPEGIAFGAETGAAGKPLPRLLNEVACHWRLTRIALALNLRDEVCLIARKEHA
jgi:ubiquinone/menaquinone biosynthesis C-methylase UbiE